MARPENFSIRVLGSSTEHKVMDAARSGDIDKLYELIGEDIRVLQRIGKKQFVDTPLHIASAEGHTDFAMEMMYLKPSFATKLNKDGLSPLHCALQKGHTRLVLSLLKINKHLVGVKGKMGYTPFHYLVMNETDGDLLRKFLKDYPDCITDVTSRGETALHVAASNNNMKALKVLLRWLTYSYNCSMPQKNSILNSKNWDGQTVLHIAVSKDQPEPEIVRLLTDLRIKTKAKNAESLTALDILNLRAKEGSINYIKIKKCRDILRHAKGLKAARKIPWLLLELISQWGYEIKHMSVDKGNALLVVTVLILTATYQATLSPPGGVLQANSPSSNDKKFSANLQIYLGSNTTSHDVVVENIEFKANNNTVGSSVLRTQDFLWFFVPNMVAFSTSFLLTCFVVLTLVSGFFSVVLMLSLSTLLFCLLDSALIIVSPNDESSKILLYWVYILVYITYLAIGPVIIPKIRKYFN